MVSHTVLESSFQAIEMDRKENRDVCLKTNKGMVASVDSVSPRTKKIELIAS